jgi:drug/metabolite transporter (DMT)-like permease
MNYRAVQIALVSAALFGASTPIAKILLGSVNPVVLAGLLYCGAGMGIAVLRRFGGMIPRNRAEVPLAPKEFAWLAGAIAAGGLVGPLLLMVGLAQTPASTSSLLLALEGVATALIAWFVFHENFDRRVFLGMICLATGALVLAWSSRPTLSGLVGPLAIVGACVAWGIDNNLTRKVSLADPLQIVELKGLIAGPVNLLLGLAVGGMVPDLGHTLLAALVGFFGYGGRLTHGYRCVASPHRGP